MRIVRLDKDVIEATTEVDGDVTRFTGTDEKTGELVKFKLTDRGFASTLISLVGHQAVSLPLADFQIISVEPTSGEWDSPGTSPEDGS
jgi:hypothetical protein